VVEELENSPRQRGEEILSGHRWKDWQAAENWSICSTDDRDGYCKKVVGKQQLSVPTRVCTNRDAT